MKNNHASVLTSWPLIASLVLLLLNDLYLKEMYSNWLTGKISDFSGLFLIATILFSYFPKYKYISFISLIIFFCFWKSPYSQQIINSFNSLELIQYGRVVDYSDLIAFSILPIALYVATHCYYFQIKTRVVKLIKVPIIVLTVLAITGTSILVPHQKYNIRKISSVEKVDVVLALKIVKDIANHYELKCESCKTDSMIGVYKSNIITLKYTVMSQHRGIMFDVKGVPSSLFSNSDSYEVMDNIKHDLQMKIGTKFENMEFVINLPIDIEFN